MNYDVVLLVGQGIGATPMISIVRDIINNMEEEKDIQVRVETPQNEDDGNRKNSTTVKTFKTKKAYYYWVTREQGSFEWFKGIMNEVAEMDKKGVIELHNYCTSVSEEGDARSALITMLQSFHHNKKGVDVVSGTTVKSQFGRPNWKLVFENIALRHPHDRVGELIMYLITSIPPPNPC